jgi:putative MFS transporter
MWAFRTISYYGFASFAPTLLHQHGFSLTTSVGYSALTTLGAVPGALLAWPVADRFGLRGPVIGFSLVFAASGVLYGLTFQPAAIIAFSLLVAALNQTLVALMYSYTPRLHARDRNGLLLRHRPGAQRGQAAGDRPDLSGDGLLPVFVFVGACGLMITLSVLVLVPGRRQLVAPAGAGVTPRASRERFSRPAPAAISRRPQPGTPARFRRLGGTRRGVRTGGMRR